MEKRGNERWELNPAHSLTVRLDGRPCSLVNLSPGGMQLMAPFPPAPASRLEVFIGPDRFEMEGRFIWSHRMVSLPDQYQFGLAFQDPPREFVRAVSRLLSFF